MPQTPTVRIHLSPGTRRNESRQSRVVLCLVGLTGIGTAAPAHAAEGPVQVRSEAVGKMPDGTVIEQYTLSNSQHVQVRVMTYGATLTGVMLPDRDGQVRNVTLYLDTCADYLQGHPLFGSVVGRYANRIAGAAFEIDGRRFELTKNMGPHHIHGGNQGFHTNQLAGQAHPPGRSRGCGNDPHQSRRTRRVPRYVGGASTVRAYQR